MFLLQYSLEVKIEERKRLEKTLKVVTWIDLRNRPIFKNNHFQGRRSQGYKGRNWVETSRDSFW